MDRTPLTLFVSFPTLPLTDWLPSGDGLIAWATIVGLAERGHRVYVVTPYPDLKQPPPAGVTIYQMNAKAGDPRPSPLAFLLWTRRVLNKLRRKTRVDLIHELNPGFSLCSLAFIGTGIPVVLGQHSARWPVSFPAGIGPLDKLRRRLLLALKYLSLRQQHRRAAAILLSTRAGLNNIARPEEHLGRIFVLPFPVDPQAFSPLPESVSGQSDAPTVLYLANVVKRKGIFTLLKAFELVVERVPTARLIVAGAGTDLEAAKLEVAHSPYADRVEFTGRVDRADVADHLRRAMVYCLPSLGEPFGMTALEAMACGKPLVVTNAGGLGELVSDEGGRRVPVNDVPALASALTELLLNPALCKSMGRHNRQTIESDYTPKVILDRLEAVYAQILCPDRALSSDRMSRFDLLAYRKQTGALSSNRAADPLPVPSIPTSISGGQQ